MLIIKNSQLEILNRKKFGEFVMISERILREEHPDIYLGRSQEEWLNFIHEKLTLASSFNFTDSKNQFVFMLSFAAFPEMLTDPVPDWASDLLTLPGTSENDRMVLFCKEVYKRNQLLKRD